MDQPDLPEPTVFTDASRPLGDGRVLSGILTLAGPQVGAELMTRLQVDLAAMGTALAQATPARDWARLRRESHALISLAGTIGAMGLCDAARFLNDATHARDAQQADQWTHRITAQIGALLAELAGFGGAA